MSIFDLPLHPKFVHVPLGLVVVLPLILLGLAIAIHKGWFAPRAWWLGVVLAVVTAASGWAALQTGERDEEQVERIVAESLIEKHEEAGEQFVVAAAFCAGVALLGAFVRRPRQALLVYAASFVLAGVALGLALRAGDLGGELVYRHHAADAFAPTPNQSATTIPGDEKSDE